MKETYKDTDLREALRRKYSDTPKLPADFMMKTVQQTEPRKSPVIWRWVTAAACILIFIGIGVRYGVKHQTMPDKRPLATTHAAQSSRSIYSSTLNPRSPEPSRASEQSVQQSVQKVRTKRPEGADDASERVGRVTSPRESICQEEPASLHYAAQTLTDDSVYQAPSRIDEFIAKLADYHKVKPVVLDCKSGTGDSTIVSMAYVFEDTKELDLFGRLLQVACWYDTQTPGYLLNFSRQQFFFSLKDLRKGEKYLWIAERFKDQRILLFSTHSPIETNISSACFQDYREQLTHKNLSTLF